MRTPEEARLGNPGWLDQRTSWTNTTFIINKATSIKALQQRMSRALGTVSTASFGSLGSIWVMEGHKLEEQGNDSGKSQSHSHNFHHFMIFCDLLWWYYISWCLMMSDDILLMHSFRSILHSKIQLLFPALFLRFADVDCGWKWDISGHK